MVGQFVAPGKVQTPAAEQVPAFLRLPVVGQLAAPQVAVVLYVQVLVVVLHVPVHPVPFPVQSALPQQEVPDTHAPVVGQILFGETHVHMPAPVQVRLLPQAALAGNTQLPAAQVPAPMRLPLVAQLATPQPTVG